MIEKNKIYTYEELNNIYQEAVAKTIERLVKTMDEAQKETGRGDSMTSLLFGMQNMMVATEIAKTLFEKNKGDE